MFSRSSAATSSSRPEDALSGKDSSSGSGCGRENETVDVDTPDMAIPTVDSRFSCNICFEPCQEPVVTQCGHLYCWPCLYMWISPGLTPEDRTRLGLPCNAFAHSLAPINPSRRVCPVCKAPTSVASLVPIYVRSNDDEDKKKSNSKIEPSPSKRPRPTDETINAEHDEPTSTLPSDTGLDNNPDRSDALSSVDVRSHDQSVQSPPGALDVSADDVDDLIPGTTEGVNESDQADSENTETGTELLIESIGLRQRLRFRSSDSEVPTVEAQHYQEQQQHQSVPNRPAANTPQRHRTTASPSEYAQVGREGSVSAYSMNPYRRNDNGPDGVVHGSGSTNNVNRWMVTPMSPNGHGASLTHGIMLSFAQATATGQQQQQQQQAHHSSSTNHVPSLHYPRSGNAGTAHNDGMYSNIDVTAETTQYLSRLLIMLTSFVILCLLLL